FVLIRFQSPREPPQRIVFLFLLKHGERIETVRLAFLRQFLSGPGGPEMAEARPLRDHKQPAGEAARRIVSVDVSERLQKRLLRQVFGVVPVPRQLPEKVENPLPVAFDERFERLPATVLSFLSELFRTRFWPVGL